MVSIPVLKIGMIELIFVDAGMKVNGQYYHYVLLSQQILPAINRVAGDAFVFQQDNATSQLAKDAIKLLQQETPDFIGPDLWPSNSLDMNLVDGKVWGIMQQRVYGCRMNSVDELKQRLVEVWISLQQNVIDTAIIEWRKRNRSIL